MIYLVAATRPNFMKLAPICRALKARGLPMRLIHTGQHFDPTMSDVFFRDLGLPTPDHTLKAGGGSHAQQTAAVLVGVEADLIENRPKVVVVVGDVTSTLAGALAASKLGIPVVHVEAGLRSRDWTMPEEINRILTDAISDELFGSGSTFCCSFRWMRENVLPSGRRIGSILSITPTRKPPMRTSLPSTRLAAFGRSASRS